MIIKGFDKFSLIDYPGKIAAIVFTAGCNFRCPYCHNPHLVFESSAQPRLSEKAILSFLEERRGKIDGIVISGGEPTLQKNLPLFLEKIKTMGYLTKVDTNASNPEKLKTLVNHGLVDSFGIDYKAPKYKYKELSGSEDNDIVEKIWKSITIALESGKLAEVKTTIHKRLLSFDDLRKIRNELDELGVRDWILQQFHKTEMIDNSLCEEESYTDFELANFAKKMHLTRVRGVKGLFFEI
ncbi:MAG TPA: anaerobic ribonucleoside-triphosphate reductase activating protein [Victivallales bacterium]|nr:anaerobic ribonucleoside-triphosphate reductase activating protein [Victivallales bacterium]HPO89934.1 anaerobic ribonucleoside-triphosphate reductase activating protein [Victivallales bacterium]HRR05744.1 anaerobic ribonucleoside-triphosphate reductase activating protein [Victivallales bacterium]